MTIQPITPKVSIDRSSDTGPTPASNPHRMPRQRLGKRAGLDRRSRGYRQQANPDSWAPRGTTSSFDRENNSEPLSRCGPRRCGIQGAAGGRSALFRLEVSAASRSRRRRLVRDVVKLGANIRTPRKQRSPPMPMPMPTVKRPRRPGRHRSRWSPEPTSWWAPRRQSAILSRSATRTRARAGDRRPRSAPWPPAEARPAAAGNAG